MIQPLRVQPGRGPERRRGVRNTYGGAYSDPTGTITGTAKIFGVSLCRNPWILTRVGGVRVVLVAYRCEAVNMQRNPHEH